MKNGELQLIGALGSPYTLKVRAVLRYGRIPFRFAFKSAETDPIINKMRPPMVPVLGFPGEGYFCDSTPLIARLEELVPPRRKVLPESGVDRVLALLIEDFCDEWLTKCVFHYRWFYADEHIDRFKGFAFHARGSNRNEILEHVDKLMERQIGRMALVGSSDNNQMIIERTYHDILSSMDNHVSSVSRFIFGERPTVGDFALYGQLTQLQKDKIPCDIMRKEAPFLMHWVDYVDDLAGYPTKDWPEISEIPPTLSTLFEYIGGVYLPMLAANEKAIDENQQELFIDVEKGQYSQPVFKYHLRCLQALRSAVDQLTGQEKAKFDKLLAPFDTKRVLVSSAN